MNKYEVQVGGTLPQKKVVDADFLASSPDESYTDFYLNDENGHLELVARFCTRDLLFVIKT